jgi:hypothetical protein
LPLTGSMTVHKAARTSSCERAVILENSGCADNIV